MDPQKFLKTLWPSHVGLIELASGVWRNGRLERFLANHVAEVATDFALAGDREWYACVSTGTPNGNGRLTVKDIQSAAGVFADVDTAVDHASSKPYPPDLHFAGKLLDMAPLKPTLTVNSGGGLQAWWLFDKPFVIDSDESRTRYVTLARTWVEMLAGHAATKGWEIDHAKDAVRLLRIVGTKNHKYGQPRDVRLIGAVGKRYAIEDVEAALEGTPQTKSRQAPRAAPDPSIETLVGEIQAMIDHGTILNFPAVKLEALRENDDQFRKTWERKRRDLGGDRSRYDAALAWIGLDAELPETEIAQLIAAHREKHSDPRDKWRRADYLARTITRCRLMRTEGYEEPQAIAQIDTEEIDTVAGSMGGEGKLLESIRQATGIRDLKRVEKRGQDACTWHFATGSGHPLVCTTAQIMRADRFAERVLSHFAIMMPKAGRRWDRVVREIAKVASFHEEPENERLNVVRDLVTAYLESNAPDPEEDWKEAANAKRPFVRDGETFFFSTAVQDAARRAGVDVNVAKSLEESGFVAKRMTFKEGEKTRGIRVWRKKK